jgi:hypothetical protein
MPAGSIPRRTALALALRAAAVCAPPILLAACGRAAPLPAGCTRVGVAPLVPGMTPAATGAFLEHNGLTRLPGYCLQGGGNDTVMVDPHWYPALSGLVPGTAFASLLPLDNPLRAANFDPQLLQPALRNVFVHNGQRFAVPLAWTSLAVWANTHLLDALRVEPPPESPGLAEFLQYCAGIRAALVSHGLYSDKAGAAVQVLALEDLRPIVSSLLTAFIQGYGGSVVTLPAPAQVADLPGLGPFAALLAYAGGDKPWSSGSAVLTMATGLVSAGAGSRPSFFPRLNVPVLPVQVYGLGCNAAAQARAAGVGLLAVALVHAPAQRALSVTSRLNPAARALAGFADWVPPGVPAAPLTVVPGGWTAAWESGVFADPLWDAALSTVWPQVAVSAEPALIEAALAGALAAGLQASQARIR